MSVDSTRPPRPPAGRRGTKKGPRNLELGRSRGCLTSKIHLAFDAVGRPLAFAVAGGNTNDCTEFTTVMEAIRVPASVQDGPECGRPCAGRPGIRLPGDPDLAATVRYPLHHPRTGRPGPQPGPAWQLGRATVGSRPRELQAAQRGGTVFQPPQAVAWCRYPLRQDRRVPPRRHLRLAPDVGVTFLKRTPRAFRERRAPPYRAAPRTRTPCPAGRVRHVRPRRRSRARASPARSPYVRGSEVSIPMSVRPRPQ